MFGESESESPRVPSPWDSLISTPPSSVPSRASSNSPGSHSHASAIELIPSLVPENDEGNVEYKLQLLSPSPARFARLVTQLKWRLLEGGGQAYYELGVADSGALVGLPRAELEESLETLEMMAGEIGASVIVVKEIEVPAVIAGLAASNTDTWNGQRKQRAPRPGSVGSESSVSLTNASTTRTEIEQSTALDVDGGDFEITSNTIVIDRNKAQTSLHTPSPHSLSSVFSMDPDFDLDSVDNADEELDDDPIVPCPPYLTIDLEIASVFKPRPVRIRAQTHPHVSQTYSKSKRLKKIKHITDNSSSSSSHSADLISAKDQEPSTPTTKASNRRAMRDRKREAKRKALLSTVSPSFVFGAPFPSPASIPSFDDGDHRSAHDVAAEETSDILVSNFAALHVSVDESTSTCKAPEASLTAVLLPPTSEADIVPNNDDDDADLFPSSSLCLTSSIATPAAGGKENAHTISNRLIVEALVVRKISFDEAFLDFEGFG